VTVQELVNLALQDIGVLATGESPSSDESDDCFDTLNHIVQSWSIEGLTTYKQQHSTHTLTAGQMAYQIGPSAAWATAEKPIKVTAAHAYFGNFQQGLEVLSFSEFTKRIANGQGATAALPNLMAADNTDPVVNIRVFPTPNISASIEVSYWTTLSDFASLATTVSLPKGFELALRHALALAMAPGFGRAADPGLVAQAQQSKAAIITLNASINGAPAPAAPAQ
jgi:hypothetical protein